MIFLKGDNWAMRKIPTLFERIYENHKVVGITDKLSCCTFIPTINFQKEEIKNADIYKVGLTIISLSHEINHINQSIIFFKGNDKNLLFTPEREGEIFKNREGGENKECILYGKVMGNINIFESLYLLNENNYEQSLDDFRNNFNNILNIVKQTRGNSKFIQIENGIFKYFYEDAIKNIKELVNKINVDSSYQIPTMWVGKINKKNSANSKHRKKCGLIGGITNLKGF